MGNTVAFDSTFTSAIIAPKAFATSACSGIIQLALHAFETSCKKICIGAPIPTKVTLSVNDEDISAFLFRLSQLFSSIAKN